MPGVLCFEFVMSEYFGCFLGSTKSTKKWQEKYVFGAAKHILLCVGCPGLEHYPLNLTGVCLITFPFSSEFSLFKPLSGCHGI